MTTVMTLYEGALGWRRTFLALQSRLTQSSRSSPNSNAYSKKAGERSIERKRRHGTLIETASSGL